MTVQDRWIDLRGSSFHFREWSASGMPIVLLHGLASQSHIFDMVAPLLAQHLRVVALDQRGHGESAKPDAGYDFENVVADLLAFFDALKLKRAILVGHSWGGNVALQFAATHPGRTAALVFVDGGFLDMQANPKMTWEFAEQRLAPPRLAGTPVEKFKGMIKQYLGALWSLKVQEIILSNFEIQPDLTIRPHLSFEHHMQVLRALWEQRPPTLYPAVKCPVLLLPARMDSTSEDERAFLDAKRKAVAAAQQMLADSETIWFNHTVHDVPLQRPRKLANTITRFAREHNLISQDRVVSRRRQK